MENKLSVKPTGTVIHYTRFPTPNPCFYRTFTKSPALRKSRPDSRPYSFIQNFNPVNLRDDIGQLWENYLTIERRKANQVAGRSVNSWFWRTYDQKEIDCLEEYGGKLHGYEFKWGGKGLRRVTREEFSKAYPGSSLETVSPENFKNFLA
jgi:hypothetical protein